jgi:transposase-like protein
MVTITLRCVHCESEAIVCDGHAPNGKQTYRCHTCGRRSRENPTSNAYSEARREVILHAYQERSSLRGLTRTFGILRTTVSNWIKKKSRTFHHSTPPYSLQTQLIPGQRRSNWMNCGHLCSKKHTTLGFGSPCVARRAKW